MQKGKHFLHKLYIRAAAGIGAVCILFSQGLTAAAETTKEERIAANRALAVESNAIADWPTGPAVAAEAAILMEAKTGTILYAKNIHKQEYPASITKILTTLIASERCTLDELVTFSHDAVFDIDRGSNHIAIDVGEKLTMEQCLNAILIRSANEVSLAVAEHISGSTWEAFADIMNERAAELGCVDSHFANPNGLPNEEHYTSAYDMAMIGRAFFNNEMLCQMTLTPMLHIPPSEYQPDDINEVNQMELIPTGKYAYEYLIGCKTGYTNDARSTLVSCAVKDGMKLICVVLKDENPYHYEDTLALFEYGFSNFEKVNVAQTETKYHIESAGSFYSENDIFGSSQPILSLNQDDFIILPKTASFSDTVSTISYETDNERQAAVISYTYSSVPVGTVSVDLADSDSTYTFDISTPADSAADIPDTESSPTKEAEGDTFIFINVVKVFFLLVLIAAAIFAGLLLKAALKNYEFSNRIGKLLQRQRRRTKRRRAASQHSTQRHSIYLDRQSSFQKQRRQQIRQAKKRRRGKRPNRFRDYDF